MKYEKFEEWMIGKKISVDGYEGVVLGRYFPSIVPSEVVCIQYKIGDNPTDWRWVELSDVTFLEEVAHEEETSTIPWEVGQVVWDVRNGRGEPFKTGEEVPFKAGDRVKFTESSLASGMIDATEGDVFTVQESYKRTVSLKELQGCYHVTHFEHVKEEPMNNTEEQEIKWEVGQEVWCLLRGRGIVECVGENEETPYIVGVNFGYTFDNYTIDGKMFDDHKGRVLFFSEPVVTAELFPPKKPFVPTLKEGDGLMVINPHGKVECYGYVEQEFEDSVAMRTGDVYEKAYYNFFKLGEEIKFS